MRFYSLIISIAFLFSSVIGFSQGTPQSCDCAPDTTGLKLYLSSISLDEESPLTFHVPNSGSTYAILAGTIGASTPSVVQNFITNYPNVSTLVFMQMPGSGDDTANLQASQLLRDRGYLTYLPGVTAYSQEAFIASGAVDMFLSGTKRIIDVTAEVGVHAWSDGTNSATNFPVGDPVHLPYINYYVSMGFSQSDAEAFYYFTINAAPASAIHNMTEAELEQYKLRTCTYNASPSYMITAKNNTLTAGLSGANYQWVDCNNGNSPISGATGQSFTSIVSGNYAVLVTENNCSGLSSCEEITVMNSAEILLAETGICIFHNPTEDNLTLGLNSGDFTVTILDAMGQIYETLTFVNDTNTIDITQLPTGTYFLNVQNNLHTSNSIQIILKQ